MNSKKSRDRQTKDIEHRNYIRLNVVFPVEFRFLDPETGSSISNIKQGFTRDIGKGGICLEVNDIGERFENILREHKPGLDLRLHIPLSRRETKAVARVVWYKKIKLDYPNKYLIGLSFEQIDQKDRNRIYFHARKICLIPKLISILVLSLIVGLSFFYISDFKSRRENKRMAEELRHLSIRKSTLEKDILVFDGEHKEIEKRLLENQKKIKEYEDNVRELIKMGIEIEKKEKIIEDFEHDREQIKERIKKILYEKQNLSKKVSGLLKEGIYLKQSIFTLSKDKALVEKSLKKVMISLEAVKDFLDWRSGDYFKLETVDGRKIFLDPSGLPFFSKGMIYAYGPDQGYLKDRVTAERIIEDLSLMKTHGYNTLNLYGNLFLDRILSWCDENKMAIYIRADYTDLPDLPKYFKEYPDFMDPKFRDMAKHSLDQLLNETKGHHSVLAIDMDQRWLFDVDWGGGKRLGIPKLGEKSIEYLPLWLKDKYGEIDSLNKVWHKEYRTFYEVLGDADIIINNRIRDLDRMSWRIDFIEYTLWTINDFLKELTEYMRTIDPHHLITYTSDLPEVIPFPISTKENSGIDFISPVHLNSKEDFNRDWIGNAELVYMTKWLNDLYQMPVYINDTGFRTSPLAQDPPNMTYALAEENNENHMAELYLRQVTLMNTYPWLIGWAYFKWYDKVMEGDFGYLRDDKRLKPVSELGQYLNERLSTNITEEKDPLCWIYYPEYALCSPYSSYQQYKSLVLMLEDDFFAQYEDMVQEALKYVRIPSSGISQTRLLKELFETFNKEWLPFAFTSSIPDDDKPIILAGKALEQISQFDRDALTAKKTITIGAIGTSDERYNDTVDLYLDLVGIKLNAPTEDRIIKHSLRAVSMDEIESSGLTPWMVSINRKELGDCKVLATFSNGDPAVVQSSDGRHIAFLYDPLTWSGRDEEISRDISGQATILKKILKDLSHKRRR